MILNFLLSPTKSAAIIILKTVWRMKTFKGALFNSFTSSWLYCAPTSVARFTVVNTVSTFVFSLLAAIFAFVFKVFPSMFATCL